MTMSKCNAKKRGKSDTELNIPTTEHNVKSKYFKTAQDNKRLNDAFFDVPCEELAKKLLGQILIRRNVDGQILKGIIVETESYLGIEDKASHSYKGKKTNRNTAMFLKPGTAYVYSIYGMYFCFNISSQGEGAAVLLRSLHPIEGLDIMERNRTVKNKETARNLKIHQLCNGPSKLCLAMEITKNALNQKDLTIYDNLWLEEGEEILQENIISTKRIGIASYGEEWASKPLRFYILGNPSVSKRDKIAESKKMGVKS